MNYQRFCSKKVQFHAKVARKVHEFQLFSPGFHSLRKITWFPNVFASESRKFIRFSYDGVFCDGTFLRRSFLRRNISATEFSATKLFCDEAFLRRNSSATKLLCDEAFLRRNFLNQGTASSEQYTVRGKQQPADNSQQPVYGNQWIVDSKQQSAGS